MSPALHRPHLAETRHTHGFGGPAPTPPPGPPCDQCGTGTSRYNPYGRCNACCLRVGYPEEHAQLEPVHPITGTRPVRTRGHTDDCRCSELRRPKMRGGKPVMKQSGGYRYVIDLTCPECDEVRTVDYNSRHRGHPCQNRYMAICHKCSKQKCSSAAKGSGLREAA